MEKSIELFHVLSSAMLNRMKGHMIQPSVLVESNLEIKILNLLGTASVDVMFLLMNPNDLTKIEVKSHIDMLLDDVKMYLDEYIKDKE